MPKIISTILITLISFTVYAQISKPPQQDIQTYRKLENGDFSNNFYLKAIIENKVTDSSVIELQKRWSHLGNDIFYKGFIKSLINKNHNGIYEYSHYFTDLNFEEFKGKYYFYQSTSLYENKELFIWGTYGKNDSDIEVHSAIGDHLELATYTAIFKTIDTTDFIIFEADEQVAVIPIKGDSAFTLKYNVDAFKKTGTYRKCVLAGDSCIQCKRIQYVGKSDQVKIQQRVFTSELLIDDIDNDGIVNFYWFAVSNRKLIKYESYIFSEGKLIILKKDIKKLIVKTPRFKEMEKISVLPQIPKL